MLGSPWQTLAADHRGPARVGFVREADGRLMAQAAVIGRTQGEAETRVMKHTGLGEEHPSEFGSTTGEAAQLTQQISRRWRTKPGSQHPELVGSRPSPGCPRATGESAPGLATSMMNLTSVHGNSSAGAKVGDYADQLATLAAESNTTAAGLAKFASRSAPLVELSAQPDRGHRCLQGVRQRWPGGYQAGNAFNKIVFGISQASATGPLNDLSKYANIIGITVKQFKRLTGQDKVVSIFDRLSEIGPKASTELNRMGLTACGTPRPSPLCPSLVVASVLRSTRPRVPSGMAQLGEGRRQGIRASPTSSRRCAKRSR